MIFPDLPQYIVRRVCLCVCTCGRVHLESKVSMCMIRIKDYLRENDKMGRRFFAMRVMLLCPLRHHTLLDDEYISYRRNIRRNRLVHCTQIASDPTFSSSGSLVAPPSAWTLKMTTVDGITLPGGDTGNTRGNYALYTSDVYENLPFKYSGDRPKGMMVFLSL